MTNVSFPVDVFAVIAGHIDNPSTYHSFALSCKHAASAVRRKAVRERALQRFTRPRRGYLQLMHVKQSVTPYALWEELPNGDNHGVMIIFREYPYSISAHEDSVHASVSILWEFNQMIVQMHYSANFQWCFNWLGVKGVWRAYLYENDERVLMSSCDSPYVSMLPNPRFDVIRFEDGLVKTVYYDAQNEPYFDEAHIPTDDFGFMASFSFSRVNDVMIWRKCAVPPEYGYFYKQ